MKKNKKAKNTHSSSSVEQGATSIVRTAHVPAYAGKYWIESSALLSSSSSSKANQIIMAPSSSVTASHRENILCRIRMCVVCCCMWVGCACINRIVLIPLPANRNGRKRKEKKKKREKNTGKLDLENDFLSCCCHIHSLLALAHNTQCTHLLARPPSGCRKMLRYKRRA